MAEVECTAGDRVWDDPRRLLFEPDCTCPRCAPPAVDGPADRGRWLRMSGSRQRLRIEELSLGETGQQLLG